LRRAPSGNTKELTCTPISKLCDELGLQPTVFYRWQKELFENGAAEKKIQIKDEVLAELMAEHVALKKYIGKL
jgi:transposase